MTLSRKTTVLFFTSLLSTILLTLAGCDPPTDIPAPTPIPTFTPAPVSPSATPIPPTPVVSAPIISQATPVPPKTEIGISVGVDSQVEVEYEWKCSAEGEITSDPTASGITYLTPASDGTYRCSVVVKYGGAGQVTRDVFITVSTPISETDEPFAAISKPQERLVCTNPTEEGFCRFEIEGTAGGVESFINFRIYTFVFPVDPPGSGWYLQKPAASIGLDGTWMQSPAYLGDQDCPALDGHTLRIRAALVQSDATYQGETLGELPGCTVLDAIEEIEGIIALSDLFELTVQR